jgi:hypothetical protein
VSHLYLYAFSEPPTTLPRVVGLEGASLSLESHDGIEAVVSPLEAVAIQPSKESVLAHARVIDQLAAQNEAVVPARFGRAFNDSGSLDAAVREREAELRTALERVRGCVELGLRVLAPVEEPASTPATGREYMLGRLERTRRDETAADELDAPLAALAREATRSLRATPQLLLSAAYLVPRGDVERFREAVRLQQEEHPELSFACTGPWAPYSFVTAGGDAS